MSTYQPLAEVLRPTKLNDFIGQDHLLKSDKPIGKPWQISNSFQWFFGVLQELERQLLQELFARRWEPTLSRCQLC